MDRFPSLSSGIQENPSRPTRVLSPLLAPMLAHEAARPSCVCCGEAVVWSAWVKDMQLLPLGQGKFYARCADCQEKDASFKDGAAV